jgi:hypothetical protein
MKKSVSCLLALVSILFSCVDDGMDNSEVIVPSTYKFSRDGITTVNFSGQTTRLLMAEEFVSSLMDPSKSEAALDGMFAHDEGNSDFSNTNLNASDKNIRSKTAASKDYFSANTTESNAIKVQFDTWIANQVNDVFPNWDRDAAPGVAGKIQEAGGGPVRYVNGKGLEYDQAVTKGLIGALMVDQILNNYLSPSILDEASNRANNDALKLEEGKNYTTMEHKWDEAFGYLYGLDNPEIPQLRADSFLNKYLARVDDDPDFEGIAINIYDSFKLGRAAIVSGNYTIRDEQIEELQEYISELIAIRVVYYLQQAKATIGRDNGAAFHDLSEGYGFIISLQFTRDGNTNKPYFSKAEVDAFISKLMAGNGFWDVDLQTLDEISNSIVSRFNFTLAEAGS